MRTAWYRSLVFWFGLPVIVFLVWAWIDSMYRTTLFEMSIAGKPVHLSHWGGHVSVSWAKPYLRSSASWELLMRTQAPRPGAQWFPLPSHASPHNLANAYGHDVSIPHWLILLAYAGLWQLPWLVRYFRRKGIARPLEA
ncbi:hypothetical protein [Haloferula sp. BvORR071]|uniref:hypothetical protein n=1 Tax=Haloferula sp. BvORR071 TaxID=1396141 RepID=UPI00055815A8|nr:hypothetical protein [Haloferula sp. BvORR071]